MSESTIAVSVICNAYNHEPYIRSALEGFVMQKTTFPFEVLIHDDASTDHTADIIREYEKKYPEIIKPIYETENQYSKRDGSLSRIQYSRVKGKYIAWCEGDDYWTDPLKLQKQYDALEATPQVDICATAAGKEKDGKIVEMSAPLETDTIFTAEDVIRGGGVFVTTASMMCRATIIENPPPFLRAWYLDYMIQIAGSLRGGLLYLAEPMSVYRLATPGSFNVRTYRGAPDAANQFEERLCKALANIDDYTSGRYHGALGEKIRRYRYRIDLRSHNYKQIVRPENEKYFRKLPRYKRLLIRFGAHYPKLAEVIWSTAKKVKHGKFTK